MSCLKFFIEITLHKGLIKFVFTIYNGFLIFT